MIIKRGDVEFAGVVEKDGKLACEKCGGEEAKFRSHIDMEDCFINAYECRCGNVFSVTVKRKWGGAR